MDAPSAALTEGQRQLLGETAPDFRLQNLQGSQVRLSDHRGQVVILDFWATWCSPCRATMPILHKIGEDFSDRGVVLYSINEGESPEQMQDFLGSLDFKPEVLLDPGMDIGLLYQVDGLPYTVMLDRAGAVEALHIGFFPNFEETLRKEVEMLAGEDQQAAR
ncbi:MAG: TlpA disulfide reductase family protein [Acidobacteriota bacterium]